MKAPKAIGVARAPASTDLPFCDPDRTLIHTDSRVKATLAGRAEALVGRG